MVHKVCWGRENILYDTIMMEGLPQWLNRKESACNAGDMGLIPGLGRYPGGGYGNPLQDSCWEKTQWTKKSGRLRSMGLQRVKHD